MCLTFYQPLEPLSNIEVSKNREQISPQLFNNYSDQTSRCSAQLNRLHQDTSWFSSWSEVPAIVHHVHSILDLLAAFKIVIPALLQ